WLAGAATHSPKARACPLARRANHASPPPQPWLRVANARGRACSSTARQQLGLGGFTWGGAPRRWLAGAATHSPKARACPLARRANHASPPPQPWLRVANARGRACSSTARQQLGLGGFTWGGAPRRWLAGAATHSPKARACPLARRANHASPPPQPWLRVANARGRACSSTARQQLGLGGFTWGGAPRRWLAGAATHSPKARACPLARRANHASPPPQPWLRVANARGRACSSTARQQLGLGGFTWGGAPRRWLAGAATHSPKARACPLARRANHASPPPQPWLRVANARGRACSSTARQQLGLGGFTWGGAPRRWLAGAATHSPKARACPLARRANHASPPPQPWLRAANARGRACSSTARQQLGLGGSTWRGAPRRRSAGAATHSPKARACPLARRANHASPPPQPWLRAANARGRECSS